MSNSIYKFRTSLGNTEVIFDPTQFKTKLVRGKDLHRREVDCIKDFQWIKGEEFVQELYDYNSREVQIIKGPYGDMWLTIELYDSYYGSPEYLLEFVSKENE